MNEPMNAAMMFVGKDGKPTSEAGRCSVPMWMGGYPSGRCGKEAYGVWIPGPMVYHASKGRMVRDDNKYDGYVPDLACPCHGGPQKDEPRAFVDGTDQYGKRMWCAVFPDFVDLQESPAEFHIKPWVAIARLTEKHRKGAN